MKNYSKKQIAESIAYWTKQIALEESLSDTTEQKLKSAAKKFAKWFGDQIKAGVARRQEDGDFDALNAIKKTIKINSSVKLSKEFLKNDPSHIVPTYAIDAVAEASVKSFVANVFEGSKALVDELVH